MLPKFHNRNNYNSPYFSPISTAAYLKYALVFGLKLMTHSTPIWGSTDLLQIK